MRHTGRLRTGRARDRGARRLVRAASLWLRVLAVCLGLHLSGLVHFAIDMWLEGEAAAEHFSDCSEDDEDCPPGCTSCHCVHGTAALPAAPMGPLTLLPAFEVAWAPYQAGTPPSLAPPGVYRPPRA
jgi:hypothetical protein